MSAPEPLFDAPREIPLWERQQAKIRRGKHPLSGVGERPALVLLAPAGTGTCGTCELKLRPAHHRRAYPKCAAGAFRESDGVGFREIWPRAAHNASSDVSSGWPACVDYQPREDTP